MRPQAVYLSLRIHHLYSRRVADEARQRRISARPEADEAAMPFIRPEFITLRRCRRIPVPRNAEKGT